MSLQVEKMEKNMAKLTIEVTAEEFEAAMEKAYQKNKSKISIQGFRKGKAPRAMIEKMYGPDMFYEDAANFIIPEAYDTALGECDLDIVSQPSVDISQIEKGKPFIFTAEVAVKPGVTLGEYKGIETQKSDVSVTEEEMLQELDKIREQNSRTVTVTDRAVQDNDILSIDFEGFVDDVAFEGGKGENFALTIGSHSFIDNFEEQLIGKQTGEETEVFVTFPEDYQAADLAGRQARFAVTIKEIKMKELPELDDDLAQDISEFESMDAYKEDVRKQILEKKEKEAKSAKEDAVIEKIVENSEMDIPDPMIDSQVKQMAEDFSRRIQSQGLSMQQYFQFTGLNANAFMEQLRPQALKRIQSRLILEAIVGAEDIKVSDEEYEDGLKDLAAMYKMELDKVKEIVDEKEKERLVMDLAVQKAVDLIAEAAVETENK